MVLDVACGIGYTVEMLLRQGYNNVKGIDISPEQVAVALKRDLPVVEANVLDHLASTPNAYDAIIAFDFVEHLDRNELFRFLDAAGAALRPSGRLIVKTLNASSPFGARTRYSDLTHELSFTEKSLRSAFHVAGLQPVLVTGESYKPFTLKGWIRWLPARAVRAAWKAYLIAELAEEGLSIPTAFNLLGVAERPGS